MAAKPRFHQGHHNPLQPNGTGLDDDSFKLVAETRQQLVQVAESAREAIQSFYNEPQQLAAFIQSQGTPVYLLPGGPLPELLLKILGFQPGFLLPDQTRAFTWLTLLLRGYDRLRQRPPQSDFSGGVLVLSQRLCTMPFLSHQLHHWLAFRSGMTGYCLRARRLYKRFWDEHQGRVGQEAYKMGVEDILALKAAIARDLEALQFLKNIANEVLIPAKQAKRLNQGSASA